MDEPLDQLYLTWLYSQVGDTEIKTPTRTYWRMLGMLHAKKFIPVIPRDVNRIEDGKELRYEFVDTAELSNVDHEWVEQPCSVLEILISLSRRLAFEAGGEESRWFWEMLENLGLRKYNDRWRFEDQTIDDILERFIQRQYRPNGDGGLFPLQDPQEDQREVELWYQMSAYILERQG